MRFWWGDSPLSMHLRACTTKWATPERSETTRTKAHSCSYVSTSSTPVHHRLRGQSCRLFSRVCIFHPMLIGLLPLPQCCSARAQAPFAQKQCSAFATPGDSCGTAMLLLKPTYACRGPAGMIAPLEC